MSKTISQFRTEPYGYFIDLSESGRVAVDPDSGNVLLDEGEGPDRYHGAIIGPQDFLGFKVEGIDENHFRLWLRFGKGAKHDLGTTSDAALAEAWVNKANQSVFAQQKSSKSKPPQITIQSTETGLTGAKVPVPQRSPHLPAPLVSAPRSAPSVNVYSDAVYLSHPPPCYGRFQLRREIGRLKQWTEDRQHSVCVVAGEGGSGKSTLAIQFLLSACPGSIAGYRHSRPDFDTGFYYSFSADPNPRHFVRALAQWIVGDSGTVPRTPRDLFALLQKAKRSLIVLDGVEELVQGAPHGVFVGFSFYDFFASFHEEVVNGPRLLVSTRDLTPLSSATRPEVVCLSTLSKGSAVEMLRSRGVQGEVGALNELADDLQHHPLCLELAGHHIREFGWNQEWASGIKRSAEVSPDGVTKRDATAQFLVLAFVSSLHHAAPRTVEALCIESIEGLAHATRYITETEPPFEDSAETEWTLDVLYRSAMITKYFQDRGRVGAAHGGNAEYFFEPESTRPTHPRWKAFLPLQQVRQALSRATQDGI